MSQPTAKPLPTTVRSAIAQAALFHVEPERPVKLVVKSQPNKQLTLTLHEGPFSRVLLRLHKKLHREFYAVVQAARKLLDNLISAMADPLPVAPVALLPATVPVRAAAPSPVRGVPAWSNTGKDTPRSEAQDVAAHRALTPRQIYERNVRFNRAKVLAQVAAGLQ